MLKPYKSSIFKKQFLSYILIICMTFLTISIVLLRTTTSSLQNHQLEMAKNYRKQVTNSLLLWIGNKENDLKNEAQYISELDDKKVRAKEFMNIIKKQISRDDSVADILVLDEGGKVINSTVYAKNTDLSSRNYFINGIKGQTTITSFYKGVKNGDPIMAIGEPVIKNGEIRYVIVDIIELSAVKKFIEGFNFGDWGHAYFVDGQGMFITNNSYINDFIKSKDVNKYRINSKAVTEVIEKKDGTGIYEDFNGQRVFGSYKWIEPLQVGLIIEFNAKATMKPIDDLMMVIRVLAFVVIISGTGLAFIMSKRIVDPINKLISSTKNIIEQDYKSAINIKTDSELDELINSFNEMQIVIKNREEELNKKNNALRIQTDKAMEANKLKGEFLANMSHELRTPLNSIIGFTNRVLKKSENILPKVQFENLNIVKQESYHLLGMINDLLDYSKLEAGKMELNCEEFDLKDVIDEVSSMIEVLIGDKPISYETIIYTAEKINTYTDRLKVKQILINLLSNAVKYSENGSIKLIVENKDSSYIISVKDEGIGIAEENLKIIFDEFTQVDGSYTRKIGGTGLGLSITKKLVEILGGEIKVKSVLNEGSIFSVKLPIDFNKNKETNDKYMQNKKHVLCIDDDSNLQKLYKQYLCEYDFEVISLSNGNNIIERVISIKPQVILLDIMLPGKDGWQLLKEIKSNDLTKNTPVIMVSVLNEQELAYKLSADGYLVKPITQDELIETINNVTSHNNINPRILEDDNSKYISIIKSNID